MKAETKIMYQRLEALQIAEELGNVRAFTGNEESHLPNSTNTANASSNRASTA